jgi:hypothetical protein
MAFKKTVLGREGVQTVAIFDVVKKVFLKPYKQKTSQAF